jgi:hypothetical protein
VLTYTHSLQPTIFNDNVNQFKVGLETDKGNSTLKVKTVMLISHFFAHNSTMAMRTINLGRPVIGLTSKCEAGILFN